MNNKDEINLKTIFKWLKSESGKKYSFWIFYLIFFVFVFFILSITNNNQTPSYENDKPGVNDSQNNNSNYENDNTSNSDNKDDNTNNNDKNGLLFKTNHLENNNYNFKLEIIKDLDITNYRGYKQENTITIENNTDKYEFNYYNGVLFGNNFEFITFLDIYEIKTLIKNSKYEYKTEYSDKTSLYKYLITNQKLNEYLEEIILENNNTLNEILVETNENNELKKITLNFISLENKENINYKIIITYGDNNE